MLKNASKLQQRWKKVKICTSCFRGPRNLRQKCVIPNKVNFLHHYYNALHQNFYTSWEFFTPAMLVKLVTFSISAFEHRHENKSCSAC